MFVKYTYVILIPISFYKLGLSLFFIMWHVHFVDMRYV